MAVDAYFPVPQKCTTAGSSNSPAVLSGSYVTISAEPGLPTSRQLTAGTNITINDTGPGGRLYISASGGGGGGGSGADPFASYVVMGTTASLSNERALVPGSGLLQTDGGPGGNVSLSIDPSIAATISGSTFVQLSGSLQKTSAGLSYLVAGANVTIASQSNGQVLISAVGGGGGGGSSGWLDGVNRMKTTGTISIDSSNRYADAIGSDVFFFVSASSNAPPGSANRKVAVIGGDLIVSGALINSLTATIVAGAYSIQPTDMFIHLSQSVNNITASLPNPALGGQYVFKDIVGSGSSFPALLKRFGSEAIDTTKADRVLQSNFGSLLVWSDGTNWFTAGGF